MAKFSVRGLGVNRTYEMNWIVTKYLITAAVAILLSEIAKRSDKPGGFIGTLPMITFLTLIWLYVGNQSDTKITNHAWYTFWYVVPTFPMFLASLFCFRVLGSGQRKDHVSF